MLRLNMVTLTRESIARPLPGKTLRQQSKNATLLKKTFKTMVTTVNAPVVPPCPGLPKPGMVPSTVLMFAREDELVEKVPKNKTTATLGIVRLIRV